MRLISSNNSLAMGDNKGNEQYDMPSLLSEVPYDQWVLVQTSGLRPSARYKHAAAVVGENLYVVGGSRHGRYLSDIQVLDLRNLKWSTIEISPEAAFPAAAGHSLVKWENQLLVVAGHSKESSDDVTVWSIDPETHKCSIVKTHGKVPTARGGQSVTLVGSSLIMFGGEDRKRRLLNDLHVLDLETMTWDIVAPKTASPSARFDHTAELYADQYLLLFGGSSHSTCFSDLYILDLHTMDWSQPETQGAVVSPRGGHASAAVNENWYIVGGGDNKSGVTETLVLSMSKLVWSVVTDVRARDQLASEGLSLCSATIDGQQLIVAFGGYNGTYNNEVFVLKPKPSDSVRPRLLQSPAAAAAAASVTAAYALTTATDNQSTELLNMNDATPRVTTVEGPHKVVSVDIDAIHAEKKILESKLVDVRSENSRFKGNLDELNNSYTELSAELQSVQGQVEAERSRCFKLEVHIAEMRQKLDSLSYVENELEALRHQKSQIETDMAVAERQNSGGVWKWVTGTT